MSGKFHILAVIVLSAAVIGPGVRPLQLQARQTQDERELMEVVGIKKSETKKNKAAAAKKTDIKQESEQEQGIEIINFSGLAGKIKEFSIDRDIFSPDPMKPANPNPVTGFIPPPPPQPSEEEKKAEEEAQKKEKNIENEIRRSLFFEGYVIKDSKNYALVSVNGEFYAVGSGDILLDKIKIINIERKTIKVEVDSGVFEIQLKGDDENENENENKNQNEDE